MWKFLSSLKVKIGILVGLILLLSQVQMARDTACKFTGLALAKEQKEIETKLDTTLDIMKQMIWIQSIIIEDIIRDSLKKKGADSTTADTFLKMYRYQMDSLLKKVNKDTS